MSNRFGRNQKRAMKLQIENASAALQMERGITRTMRQRLDEQASVIRLVADVLGPNFVGLPPEEMRVESGMQEIQVIKRESMPVRAYSDDQVMRAVHSSVLRLEMHALSADVDRLRGDIHFRYISRSGQVGYAISRETWASLPESARFEIAHREIARDMARVYSQVKP